MKKILLITFGGILFFILIIFIVNYFDTKKNNKELATRKFLNEIKEQKNWNVIKITDKSSLSQYNNPNELNIKASVFYDSIQKQIYVEVTDWNTPSARIIPDENKEWINFDVTGKIIKRGKIDSLKNIPLTPLSSETIQENSGKFYIVKYIKGKTNWNAFNPFRGMGNPNGVSENIYSDGFAFINLVVKNDTLKFKTKASRGEFDINTKISLYSLNTEKANATSFKIIEIKSYKEEKGLYLLYRKIE